MRIAIFEETQVGIVAAGNSATFLAGDKLIIIIDLTAQVGTSITFFLQMNDPLSGKFVDVNFRDPTVISAADLWDMVASHTFTVVGTKIMALVGGTEGPSGLMRVRWTISGAGARDFTIHAERSIAS